MVTSTVVMLLIGLFALTVGLVGLSGKALRVRSGTFMGNFTAQALFGAAIVGMVVATSMDEDSPVAGGLALVVVAMFLLGMWSLFVRPPKWLQPTWQREMDDADRRSRR